MIDRSKFRQSQRGFTLAEILVTTAIFAIIMIAALAVYDKSNQVFKQSSEAADLQQSTRIAFDKLVADVRMAGFDYNRGGPPTGAGEFPQPDEQVEYAGVAAVAFRSNFNYNSAAVDCAVAGANPCGNGLEPAFTPKNALGAPIFPYVTTNNDEVVIYALRSNDPTKNTDKISFYMDASKPRAAYPDSVKPSSPTNGQEIKITIDNSLCATCGVDQSNANPPYTLYRMTVSDVLNKLPGTPVAENIRSLRFIYYMDPKGSTILGDPPAAGEVVPTPIEQGRNADGEFFNATYTDAYDNKQYTGAVGGDGKYDANQPDGNGGGNFVDRQTRAFIQSVRVELVGMNAQPDAKYVEPTETMASIQNYRQYHLSALIAPRNLGLTGFPEPAYNEPEPPAITSLCVVHCAAPVICWSTSSTGAPVLEFIIEWDTNPLGSFSAHQFTIADPTATSAILPDDGIDPSATWWYRIRAINDNGSSQPSNSYSIQPKNATKPMPPEQTGITYAKEPNSDNPANTDYAIALQFVAPKNNDPSDSKADCVGSGKCAVDELTIPAQEQIHYNVWRSTDKTLDFAKAVKVLAYSSAQTNFPPGSPGTWVDSPTTSAYPPGTCVEYYYFLQAVDRCYNGGNPSWNVSGNAESSASALNAGVVSNFVGQAYDAGPGVTANAPVTVSINTPTSACPNSGGTNCDIDLRWSKVTADSNGNAIGVDRYRINRYHKRVDEGTYQLDDSFLVSGFSSVAGGTVGHLDSSAPAFDSAGKQWYYRYTIQAEDCRAGTESTPVDYPTPCAANPTIIQSGASNGVTASGTTPNDPWIFNGGDSVSVQAASGAKISSVVFDVITYPEGKSITSFTDDTADASGYYIYSWADTGVAGQIYYLKMTVTYDGGCQEIHVRYVQEFIPSSCAFDNNTISFSTVDPGTNLSTSGATTTVTHSFTVTNSGQDSVQVGVNGRSGVSSHKINILWADPSRTVAGVNPHDDMKITSIRYQVINGATTTTVSDNSSGSDIGTSAATATETRTLPSNLPDIQPGGQLTVEVKWQYKKTGGVITATPLSKICLAYNLFTGTPSALDPNDPSEKFCNIVGKDLASTKNPTSCD